TDRGEIIVSITAAPTTAGGCEIHLAVRDSGIGIPRERFDLLFQSFSQVDVAIQRRYGGTGPGLAVCRKLAELIGGRVWADSEPGQGSTFHATIPFAAAQPGTADASAASLPSLAHLRVWVIDGSETLRSILLRQLQRLGIQARSTGSPAEALDWARSG